MSSPRRHLLSSEIIPPQKRQAKALILSKEESEWKQQVSEGEEVWHLWFTRGSLSRGWRSRQQSSMRLNIVIYNNKHPAPPLMTGCWQRSLPAFCKHNPSARLQIKP